MKKSEKEILEKYLKTVWDSEKTVNHEINKISEFVILDNDTCIIFEKPGIKTKFYFGYTLNENDTELFDNACECSDIAKNKTDYFLDYNYKIGLYKKSERYVSYPSYKLGRIHYVISLDMYKKIKEKNDYNGFKTDEPYFLSESENERINKAKDKANDKFKKRLESYLKKYGLSKIQTYTYWEDR